MIKMAKLFPSDPRWLVEVNDYFQRIWTCTLACSVISLFVGCGRPWIDKLSIEENVTS